MTDMSDDEKKARVRFLIICSICCFSEYLTQAGSRPKALPSRVQENVNQGKKAVWVICLPFPEGGVQTNWQQAHLLGAGLAVVVQIDVLVEVSLGKGTQARLSGLNTEAKINQ